MQAVTVSKYNTDAAPKVVLFEDGECPFCKAAYDLVKWANVGDVIYLVINEHIHEVECSLLTSTEIAFVCRCIAKSEVDAILRKAMMRPSVDTKESAQ